MKILLVACLAACQSAHADEPPISKRFEHDMIVRFHMHENFGLLRAIEKLIVRGKLDDAKAFAQAIALAPDEPGYEPFAKRAAVVRARAAELAASPTVADACKREAHLAAACADCHAEAGVVPEFDNLPRTPADESTIAARMARHLWATDRLWEGVVGDSDAAWRAGLDVLATSPLPWAQIHPERVQLGHQLQHLAESAKQSRDRAGDYGDILATCAACHALAR